MRFLLDTCAVLWLVSDPKKISRKTLADFVRPRSEIFLSAASVAEIACSYQRNRIQLDRPWKMWLRHYAGTNDWGVLPMDWTVLEEAWSLPGEFHRDPADRVIVATARLLNLKVVTADARILAYPHVSAVS